MHPPGSGCLTLSSDLRPGSRPSPGGAERGNLRGGCSKPFIMDAWLSDFIAAEGLPADFAETALAICGPLAARIVADRGPPGQVVGVCGSQASGKSTLTAGGYDRVGVVLAQEMCWRAPVAVAECAA